MRFSNLRPWQKGFLGGCLFTAVMGFIFTAVLIVFDVVLNSKGIPTSCYMVFNTAQCPLSDAIFSRLLFFVIFTVVFGVPIGVFAGLLGYFIEKIHDA